MSPGSKKTVLIAPSWGTENVLESCGKQLVRHLLNNGYNVMVRPHPETIKRSPKLINMLHTEFSGSPDFTLEKSVATDDSLLKSDVLICDCSGVALEYAFGTERPVLFLDVPYKIQNKKYKELAIEPFELSTRTEIGVVVSPEKIDELSPIIEKLIAEYTEYKTNIVKLRGQNIYAFGHSSEVGAKHIVDVCG
jgi:YidC/Oxa1 family membrane protein insertase